mmetsp:Transcript_2567/g.4638  ORF Transcript_2567/g.4638 Transcript_2567/m.4638 type:complete len:450 (+) Transcript_2567:107-1456(+)
MVVPVQMDPLMLGTPSPEVLRALLSIRWCVMVMYACIAIRLLQGDSFFAALTDFIPALAGTFLLRDDEWFGNFVRSVQPIVPMFGQGGLMCLPSFMVLCGMNGTLGIVRVASYGTLHIPGRKGASSLLPFMVLTSSVVDVVASIASCWTWKVLHRSRAGLLDDAADVEHGQLTETYQPMDAAQLRQAEAMRRAIELARLANAGGAVAGSGGAAMLAEEDPAVRYAIQQSMRAQGGGGGEEDHLLAQAIQASQAAALAGEADPGFAPGFSGFAGSGAGEDPELERALRESQHEEDRHIMQEQDREFEESLAMDQVREQQEREAREEEQRREEEARAQAALEEQRRVEEEAAFAKALEEKRLRLPAEPPAGTDGRVSLLFRLPRGTKKQRAFLSSDIVGSLYDYVEVEDEEMARSSYRLVSQAPRRVYEVREQTLEAAGVENQSVILAEVD